MLLVARRKMLIVEEIAGTDGRAEKSELTEPRAPGSLGRCSRTRHLSWLALFNSGGSLVGPVVDDVRGVESPCGDPIPSLFPCSVIVRVQDRRYPLPYQCCWEVTPLFKYLWLVLGSAHAAS